MGIKEQNNNFQNSENETGQNFNGANIGNQNNYFLNFKFDWIFKKYKSNQISSFQFGFLFFSRFPGTLYRNFSDNIAFEKATYSANFHPIEPCKPVVAMHIGNLFKIPM